MRKSVGPAVLVLLAVVLRGAPARAYPSSVLFAPTGESRPLGTGVIYAFSSLVLTPSVAPGPTWVGTEVGILPTKAYGKSGVAFGGAELGLDVLNADLMGTPDAFVKVELNAKITLVTEGRYSPSVGVGVLGLAPWTPRRSMNLLYLSTTKTLEFGRVNLGKLTLAFAGSAQFGAARNDPYRDVIPLYQGTWPFPSSSKLGLMVGYESPRLGRFGFTFEWLGGECELCSTNVAVNLAFAHGMVWGLGGWVDNDTSTAHPQIGLFTFLGYGWQAKRKGH